MPMVPFRWLFLLLGLFVIAGSADLYFTYSSASATSTSANQRVDVADFFAAARANDGRSHSPLVLGAASDWRSQ